VREGSYEREESQSCEGGVTRRREGGVACMRYSMCHEKGVTREGVTLRTYCMKGGALATNSRSPTHLYVITYLSSAVV
jgi:hypothetical protein